MGNLAINECYIHQKIYQELIDLIVFLKKRFNYSVITAGGNLNLPKSKEQKLHIDDKNSNLAINVPLVDVTMENGPLAIVGTSQKKIYKTAMFMSNRLYRKKKYITTNLGHIILRFSNTWHAGTANKTDLSRAMLNFTLRKTSDFKVDNLNNYLIENREFVGEIGFNGNIYPNNTFGKIVELTDFYLPSLSRILQYTYNVVKN
jgi:hypothetical protein